MKVKVKNIEWDVSEEDMMEFLPDDIEEEDITPAINKMMDDTLEDLPNEVDMEFDSRVYSKDCYEDIENEICDRLAENYGWCVYDFDYDIEEE